jgi:probable addiction module antidote protein
MRKYRTLSDVTEEYYLEHPEEIEGFLKVTFEEYATDSDAGTLLSALRIISRVKGISKMADEIGMTRQGLQKSLSVNGNPRLENINSIMQALGYRLVAEKLPFSHYL